MGQADRMRSNEELEIIEKVTKIFQKWPAATSGRDGFGYTTLRVNKKPFVIVGGGHDGAKRTTRK